MKAKHSFRLLSITLAVLLSTSVAASIKLNLDPGQDILIAGESQVTYIRIGLEGIESTSPTQRAPINVALVLDRSGSMQGEKLHHAKQAAKLALDYLQPGDIISLVTYNHTVQIPVGATRFTNRRMIERAIDKISARGNTALFAGVSKGAAEVNKFKESSYVNRVILLSDGLANVGPSTPAELRRLGQRLGGQSISVTTIGLGLGYNEDLMVRLAEASDGNHVFAERPEELASIFRNEFGELETVVAQDVTITIHLQDGVTPIRILGREADIRGNKVTARMNQVYGSQEKYLMLEVKIGPNMKTGEAILATVDVEFDDMLKHDRVSLDGTVRVRFGESKKEAVESVKREVMISVSEQIAVEMDDEALQLKDQGDAAGARRLFEKKADYLESRATAYDSEKLGLQGAFTRKMQKAVTAPAAEWKKARKEVREEQYIIRNQQSYK